MARETRRIGIRTAQIRLPGPASAGPALLKTASGIANREFEKAADKRTQEAQIAAASLNFERDSDGNLMAPTVPIAENGLLAPSIYDRKYTQMVGQRYLQQTQIDVSERVNLIAAENPFDPEAFRVLAEGYVTKVTELAPDFLKPDVNNTAQVKMVEHYNHIIRVKAERDHAEARGLQLQTIDRHMNDLSGYVSGDADPEVIGAKMLEARAAIEEGDEFHFWLDDEKQQMLDGIDRQYAISSISSMITSLTPGDEVASAEMALALNGFANGEGSFPMVDPLGNIINVPLDQMPISPDERIAIAGFATSILAQQTAAFGNVQDARLKRDWEDFYNWFSNDALARRTAGEPLDMDRLYNEFDKANRDVLNFGYDDTLRENIRSIIEGEFVTDNGNMSQWRKDFLAGYIPWTKRYNEEIDSRLDGRDRDSLSAEELVKVEHGARMAVGNVAGGNQQTADGSREIRDFYGTMTGRDMTQDYFEDLIADPNAEGWSEIDWLTDTHMSKIGIWPQELSNAIIGKINAPEGMNTETLDATMRLARVFWDNPTFRNNMTDENALGRSVGGALDHLFRFGGQPTVGNVTKLLENYSDPRYSPRADFNSRPDEEKQGFRDAAESAIKSMFVSNWRTAWIPTGLQTQGLGFNPLDADLAGIPREVMDGVMDVVVANAGHIDTDDPDSFGPFISRSVNRVMHDKGYAPSTMGFSEVRHGEQFHGSLTSPLTGWTRPDSAIVQRPPEYYATKDKNGNLDGELINIVEENFQVVLDFYGEREGQSWKVDINAALEFDGQATAALGYPNWNVILLRADGTRDILTKDGKWGGDRVLFDMREAELRRKAEKRVESERRNQFTRNLRTDFQTGSSQFTNPGSAQ